jgi:hypothetical protein
MIQSSELRQECQSCTQEKKQKAASAECVFGRLDLSLKKHQIFGFPFISLILLLLPFGLSFNWPHTLKDLDFSVFLSHSSSHTSSSCVIITHRH